MFTIERGNPDYAAALNYNGQSYFNNPCTVEIYGKLFIIGAGTSDSIQVRLIGGNVHVVSQNEGLEYIGLEVINLEDNSIQNCYLDSNDINSDEGNLCFEILDKDTDEQIKILQEYLPY